MSTISSVSTMPGEGQAGYVLQDLNTLLRQSLKKHEALTRQQQVILRCASLPVIPGNQTKLELLFDHLLQMILSYPPNGSRLFLNIDCQEQDGNLSAGHNVGSMYQILFHTNICSDASWKEANRNKLTECMEILALHNGALGVNTIENTGCLFVISLPGKMND
jgi:light-regulated signal transduction histidine kinase (bacteriophytochrome)